VFLLLCLLGAGCDLGTKAWAVHALTDVPGQTVSIIAPWLEASLSYNEGTAFSFVRDLGDLRGLLGGLSFVLVALMGGVAVRKTSTRLDASALGILAGGAVGNGFDRLFRAVPNGTTGVVDFIEVNYPWGGSWPTFNVADAWVAVGVGLLLFSGMRKRPPPTETSPST
jgi:lipoprotein signal peptidase